MASVGMDARGEFANPPGGYGLPGRYGPAHTAAARAPVSPYSSSLSRVIGSGGAIAAEPMGPLPHAYGTPVSPAAVSPYSSVAAVSPYAGAVQAQPYSAPVQTWGAPLVSGIQPRPPSAAAPLGSLQPTMPSTTAAPTSGLAPTTVGTAGRAPAGMQTAPISPPAPSRRPSVLGPVAGLASAALRGDPLDSGHEQWGWAARAGGDAFNMTRLGPALAAAGLAVPGLGLLGTAGNIWNGLEYDEARSALDLPGQSLWQWLGTALGLNSIGSGMGDAYAGALTREVLPSGTLAIRNEPGRSAQNANFGGRTAGGATDIRPRTGGSGRGGRTGGMDGSNRGAATGPGLGGLY